MDGSKLHNDYQAIDALLEQACVERNARKFEELVRQAFELLAEHQSATKNAGKSDIHLVRTGAV
jgi:hypothetical protein